MIPNIMFDTGSEGEVRVFESLRNQLPNTYIVMHSVRWIGGTTQSQGEADFIIFHPQKGVMVIEVKAGILEYKNREWYQTNRNTGIAKQIRDPEEQASNSKFELIKTLNSRKCLVCHAVWFPSVCFDKATLPMNYDEAMLFDQMSLLQPQKDIDRAFSYWGEKIGISTNLDNIETENIINTLAPNLRLIPSMKIDYDNAEKHFIQLTREQAIILDFLKFQKKAVIAGAAGTGKTLIAIEKARQLHNEGKKTLFLCFNNLLATYLNKQYSHYGFKISTFDSLASSFGVTQPTYEKTRTFFLELLLDDNSDFFYTNIVIDEGQDFENDWLEYLEYRATDCFYVFYDENQSLYNKELPSLISNAPTKLTLSINCRNTEAIAKTAYGAINLQKKSIHTLSGVKGIQPTLLPELSIKDLAKQINLVINDFCIKTSVPLHNVAVITMNTWNDSILKKMSNEMKIKWGDSLEENMVHFNTARKYKGLEADLLIITDLDWNSMQSDVYKRLLYTTCSRAKHQLYIVSPNIEDIDTELVLRSILGEESKRVGTRKFLKLLNLKS